MAKEGELFNRPTGRANEGLDFRAYMKGLGKYDKELEMFCEDIREPKIDKLRFLRWMAEQGKLEHEPSGPPAGDLTLLIQD